MSAIEIGSIFAAPSYPPAVPEDFDRCVKLLQKRAGIVLGEHKREMIGRILGARAKAVNMQTIRSYLDLLAQNPGAQEWEHFINAFTINHTAFFRERHHFEMLADFVKRRRAPVSIWCCAASTGEEVYTIALTLAQAGHTAENGARIWATDIDTEAVQRARQGVYSMDRVKPVPPDRLRTYFQRGTGKNAGMVRVKPVLRNMVEFDVLNLLDPSWPIQGKFDAIFCRNIMIYFDKETQSRILDRFAPVLKPDGLLFAGHSENFTYLTKAFRLRGQTVYVRS
ncbi:CheR family methyltransferase [Paracandidimonas soli]|jgi:chemotaxis protein methyltransferase CheR|uniref:Chemotaxis protein methyltransferase n=1 Tax=Paracandidimonas soli TaxID=1917182 RepID=A0A4R3VB16_9BURK|nr:CheR family methyltransferase [Paracandidimonas soli]TCV00794.1 chemotaxis protein methyltransferase CheR [Paracandidimonas soli]